MSRDPILNINCFSFCDGLIYFFLDSDAEDDRRYLDHHHLLYSRTPNTFICSWMLKHKNTFWIDWTHKWSVKSWFTPRLHDSCGSVQNILYYCKSNELQSVASDIINECFSASFMSLKYIVSCTVIILFIDFYAVWICWLSWPGFCWTWDFKMLVTLICLSIGKFDNTLE